jgi:hypothetical protein
MLQKTLITIPIFLALTACGKPPLSQDESYFPLQEGMQWTYKVTTEVAGRSETRSFSETNAGSELLDGIAHSVRVTDEGTRYYLRQDDSGIYRAAKRTVVELAAKKDPDPRWVLKRPYQIGTGWYSLTRPYVLRRINPYEETLSRGSALKMAYQITATDAVADVPAGRFDNCLLVEGEANLTLYADGREGYKEILINTREWYAPGFGLVKLVREEPMDGTVFTGGRMVFELVTLDE